MPAACALLETQLPGSPTRATSPRQRLCAAHPPPTIDPHDPHHATPTNQPDPQLNHQVDYQPAHLAEAIAVNLATLANSLPHLLERPTPKMAATAKHELRNKFHGEGSGDEDIAAIAKQISDHAEAIYQTWKSRGLAPTEILSCNASAAAADKFGSALSPTGKPSTVKDLLVQSPDNLEKLVSDFVVEDKARIAANRKSPVRNLPSSIQFALQKFERNARQNEPKILLECTQLTETKSPAGTASKQTAFVNKLQQMKPKTTPRHKYGEVFLETIETSGFGPTVSEVPKSEGPAGGLTTWPLKNKMVKKSPEVELKVEKKSPVVDASYLDQVALEEKRLIDALKTGLVLSDEFPGEEDHQEDEEERRKKKEEEEKKKKKKLEEAKKLKAEVQKNNVVRNSLTSNVANGTCKLATQPNDVLVTSRSIVNYAKVKYNASAQAAVQKKAEESKPTMPVKVILTNHSEQSVSVTRSKFEPPSKKEEDVVDSGGSGKDEKDSVISRWGPRINAMRPRLEAVPHPELTTQQKQHIRAAVASTTGTPNNPVRPFLTRGSVAERVMIFEKCPSELFLDKRNPRQPVSNNWKNNADSQNKNQVHARDNTQQKQLPPHTTLQRHVKSNKSVHIPRFYFPRGKPALHSQVENTITRITAAFQSLPSHRATRAQFHNITTACELPLYWKVPLFLAVGGDQKGYVEFNAFLEFWKELTKSHHDAASKFVRIITRGLRDSICPEDLFPLVQDVVETHPGLTFLKEATEFHSRYVHTVIARIFYCVNRSWSGKISLSELRRSNLLSVISILEQEEDINQVTDYFSYEHFYVIYCKFWELDRDHDLFIDKVDLTRHNDYALSSRIIDRIFSGAVTRGGTKNKSQDGENKMSYTEFVWFLLSEEDKNHPTAIEYWFRCMDLDGDGYLSMYELEYFYEEQLHRMEVIAIETLPFEDCLCQMLDMIHPVIPGKISLSDLKKCKMTSIFFDTFFNVEKYLDHEQRDPFASARDHDADGHELSDWDRFAAEEYELLVAEESGNEQNDNSLYHSSNDSYSPNVDVLVDSLESGQVGENVYPEKMSSMNHPKMAHYDSCDSDDYAESDE